MIRFVYKEGLISIHQREIHAALPLHSHIDRFSSIGRRIEVGTGLPLGNVAVMSIRYSKTFGVGA